MLSLKDFYRPVSLFSVRIFNQVFIIPMKDNDRNDEIETKHVWIINVPLVMMDSKLIFPVVRKQLCVSVATPTYNITTFYEDILHYCFSRNLTNNHANQFTVLLYFQTHSHVGITF